MTFLPILERELRVRARRGSTYWSRSGVALAGLLICLPQLFAGGIGPMSPTGKYVFDSLVVGAFLLCGAASVLTADAISAERREGTLGLLFLTRVRSIDVLWGKLGSTGLACLCVLVGFLPVLMIPVMAGGVTGGEAFRKALALLNVLFLALVTGLLSSARETRKAKAFAVAIFWLCVLLFLPFFFEAIAVSSSPHRLTFGLLSPLVTVIYAGDANYRSHPQSYWLSLVLVNTLSWLLVAWAAVELRRRVREEGAADAASVSAQFRPVDVATRRRWRSSAADFGPVEWLVRRQPGVKVAIWATVVVASLFSVTNLWYYRILPPGGPGISWYLMMQLPSLAVTLLDGILLSWVASRFFVEARRSGEFELLLTTPLGARTILSGQWAALKRLLRWPVAVLLAMACLRMLEPLVFRTGFSSALRSYYLFSLVLSMASTVAGIAALCWLGIWFGLRSHGQAAAIAWTVGLAKGVPYIVSLLGFGLLSRFLFSLFRGSPGFSYSFSWLPQIGILLLYLWLIRQAKRRLVQALAGEPIPHLRHSVAAAMTTIQTARHWAPTAGESP